MVMHGLHPYTALGRNPLWQDLWWQPNSWHYKITQVVDLLPHISPPASLYPIFNFYLLFTRICYYYTATYLIFRYCAPTSLLCLLVLCTSPITLSLMLTFNFWYYAPALLNRAQFAIHFDTKCFIKLLYMYLILNSIPIFLFKNFKVYWPWFH